jgi:hypothetical protein
MLTLHKEVAALSRADCLDGLKRIIPPSRIKRVLRDSGKDRAFCPRLSPLSVVRFVLGLGLFCRDCYRQVFRWINPYSDVPGRSTLCEARQRVGVKPLVDLARQTVRLLAEPATTPGAFYRGMRLVALDGFVLDVPDSPDNARVFGRPQGGRTPGAFPQVRVVALCEVGTHVLFRWLSKPITIDERPMAERLMRELSSDMLLMWDRNFLSYNRVRQILGRGANLLAKIKKNLIFQPIRRLGDGSFLARIYPNAWKRRDDREGILVRIIEYRLDDPTRPGGGEKHRLLSTLLDEKLDPAPTLIELYHGRWEEELAIDEFKTHEIERITLRSQTPAGVVQELNGLLLDHFVIRTLMYEAAQTTLITPLRLSFTGTLKILRCRIPQCPNRLRAQVRWWSRLIAEIAEEKIELRRNRINPRVIKKKMSKWPKKRRKDRHYPQPTKSFRNAIVMIR